MAKNGGIIKVSNVTMVKIDTKKEGGIMEYGLARISTSKQNIERQVRNIFQQYPNAKIIQETYTGTTLEGRKELDKLLKILKAGDTLIFDSVSRMSRNAEEGWQLYEELYDANINIVFLKEPHINTETYKQAMQSQIDIKLNTGNKATEMQLVDITLLNKNGEEIITIGGIIEALEPGANTQFNSSMTLDYTNVYDFKITLK